MRESETIETPSGKGAEDENFPVASRFLRPEDRPLVMAYYAFARAADDIADNPELSPEDKTARLERFRAGLEGRERNEALATANRLGDLMRERAIAQEHAGDLLLAFQQDARKARYASWEELRDYCRLSAEPVGRFLLDLHGEDRALYPGANALCSALQVLNHLQDLRSDYLGLGRIYLPEDWMADEKVEPRDLAAFSSSAGLRRVIDDCLWRSDSLLAQAEGLLAGLQSRRLLVQAATTHRLAETLLRRLLRRDPLARPVKLTRMDFLLAGARGLLWGGLAR
jgi:squalene synthase HpnC